MILPPNTTNQIKIQDFDGDILMADVMSTGEVVLTIKRRGEYSAALLTADDASALVRHLLNQGVTL